MGSDEGMINLICRYGCRHSESEIRVEFDGGHDVLRVLLVRVENGQSVG
jgi:hypothetical protein